MQWLKANGLKTVIIVFVLWYGIKYLFKLIRLIHLHRGTKNLVYMKVTLPRSDSKMDQEKRTEKDFKEKVAMMAQLYRALYEIREMNL